jgi:hypothetical protein
VTRSFQATCTRCGRTQRRYRHEFLHATQPHCERCGGTLELSGAARRTLGEVHDAQRGETQHGRRRPTDEPPARLIPERETTRYEFHEFPDLYRELLGRGGDLAGELKAIGPAEFYQRRAVGAMNRGKSADHEVASDLLHQAEGAWYAAGRPYYKVWPSIAEALCHTDMRVDGEFFRLPFAGVEVRLPVRDNPLEPCRALVAARIEATSPDRDWSLVIAFTDGPPGSDRTLTWIADMPVRVGLSLEDALDQTALLTQCPDSGLARRAMRVVVGVAFFGLDRHEVILPDLPRRVVERYRRERRQPTEAEGRLLLQEAREAGLHGWRVGSEIVLPTATVEDRDAEQGDGERHLTAGHVRRGHMRWQAYGERHGQRRLQFIPPTVVRADLPLRSQHGYRVQG